MRLALTLGGTDDGRSGIGVYVRAIIPRLWRLLQSSSDELVLIGTQSDFRAYEDISIGARRVILPAAFTNPGPNALMHWMMAGVFAAHEGATVLLLPAANRRIPMISTIPTVAVVHDLGQLHVAKKYDALRMAYFRYAVLPAIRHATRVVAISEFTRRDLSKTFDWPASRLDVVRNGVDAEKFSPPVPNDLRIRRAREFLHFDAPYVLYLSRLEHPGKNHLRLIEAFAASERAAHHSLVLAGADWGGLSSIRELVNRLGIESRVHLPGFIPDEIVPGLLAAADAVAMVGLYEGFGLPVLEALAAGRPVFVSKTGALTEVSGDLAAVCDPFDCTSIRLALEKAISDVDFRHRAMTEGPLLAEQNTWDQTAQSLLEICRNVSDRQTKSIGFDRDADKPMPGSRGWPLAGSRAGSPRGSG